MKIVQPQDQTLCVQLEDGNARRMIHLARLIATLIASKAVPVTILKVCSAPTCKLAAFLKMHPIQVSENCPA